jgi:hypothetical protein
MVLTPFPFYGAKHPPVKMTVVPLVMLFSPGIRPKAFTVVNACAVKYTQIDKLDWRFEVGARNDRASF